MELREHVSQELSALVNRLVADADARTYAQIEDVQRAHQSEVAALQVALEQQARELDARTQARVAEIERRHQTEAAALQVALDQQAIELDARTQARVAEVECRHQTEIAALRLSLDEQSLELEARAAALDQLSATLAAMRSRLDLQQTEADTQRTELESARRQLSNTNAGTHSDVLDLRIALESAQAETQRLTRQFETALEDLRTEHLTTLQDQALARTILPLEELLTVFEALGTASTPSAVLTAVVSGLAREFSRVALFRLRGSRLECVSHVGFEFEGDIAKVVIPAGVDSLMARALNARRTQTFISGTSDEPCTAPFGGTPACAVALPLMAGDATVAVIYADDSDQLEFGSVPAELLVKFAELVWQHAILVLQRASGAQKTLAVKPLQRFDRLA
jgi:hypothetical protein